MIKLLTIPVLLLTLVGCVAIMGTPHQRMADKLEWQARQKDCSKAESVCMCRADFLAVQASKTGMFQNVKQEVQKTDRGFHEYVVLYPNNGDKPIEVLKWKWKARE